MAVDLYFIDFPQRVKAVQAAMAEHGIDVYLGSRLRTLSDDWGFLSVAFFHYHSSRRVANRLHFRH